MYYVFDRLNNINTVLRIASRHEKLWIHSEILREDLGSPHERLHKQASFSVHILNSVSTARDVIMPVLHRLILFSYSSWVRVPL